MAPISVRKEPENYLWCKVAHHSPVKLCGEYTDNCGDSIDFYYVCDRLQNIKVEEGVPRNWAVEPSFQKGCPVFLQDPLGPPHVIFTYACHTGIHSLSRAKTQGKGRKAWDTRKTVFVSELLVKHQRERCEKEAAFISAERMKAKHFACSAQAP